jgi:hypothetical protein
MNRAELEAEIGIELPNNFETYDDSVKESVVKYLKQLNRIEKHAYTIGKSHLGTSFNVLKSNGYNDWLKKQNK